MLNTNAFASLSLKPELLDNLNTLDYQAMTPIQAQSLPLIIQGKDVIAQAQTGSGKTAAFGLGLLQALDVKKFRIQSMVLCPTRELADQVAKEIRKLARGIHNIKVLTLCGGVPQGPQIGSLEHGAHIIVGTPGRIEDHINKNRLDLSHLSLLILDEADRMLEMGFQDSVDAVINAAPKNRQTLLFSATFPDAIQSISAKIMNKPERVVVESTHNDESIKQHFYFVEHQSERLAAVKQLLLAKTPETCVIFCNTKVETIEVTDYLAQSGFSVLVLNGDLEQRDRDQTLVQFVNKSISILVATDVASRGLDIDALDMVINYQLPYDPEVHVHRIGRTGRAGSKGFACSLFTPKDASLVSQVEEYCQLTVVEEQLPIVELNTDIYQPSMVTLRIDGGKKQKVRPGDILGALTGDKTIEGKDVGKIQLFEFCAYVAVKKSIAKMALRKLEQGKLKGRKFRVWHVK